MLQTQIGNTQMGSMGGVPGGMNVSGNMGGE